MSYLIVFLGAGIGGAGRHGMNMLALRLFGIGGFPFGTLAINIVGSLLMGIAAEYFALRTGIPQQWRLFLATGILGGFTTFSAFSLETALLLERGETLQAVFYALASTVVSVAARFCGLAVIRLAASG